MSIRQRIALSLALVLLALSLFGCVTVASLEDYDPSAADVCASWCASGAEVTPPGCDCD